MQGDFDVKSGGKKKVSLFTKNRIKLIIIIKIWSIFSDVKLVIKMNLIKECTLFQCFTILNFISWLLLSKRYCLKVFTISYSTNSVHDAYFKFKLFVY